MKRAVQNTSPPPFAQANGYAQLPLQTTVVGCAGFFQRALTASADRRSPDMRTEPRALEMHYWTCTPLRARSAFAMPHAALPCGCRVWASRRWPMAAGWTGPRWKAVHDAVACGATVQQASPAS